MHVHADARELNFVAMVVALIGVTLIGVLALLSQLDKPAQPSLDLGPVTSTEAAFVGSGAQCERTGSVTFCDGEYVGRDMAQVTSTGAVHPDLSDMAMVSSSAVLSRGTYWFRNQGKWWRLEVRDDLAVERR